MLTARPLKRPAAVYLAVVALSLWMFRQPLAEIVRLALRDEHFTHLILIPFLAGALIAFRRKQIFATVHRTEPRVWRYAVAALLTVLTGLLHAQNPAALGSSGLLTQASTLLIAVWGIGFVLCFGMPAFRLASFAFLFLILFVALPPAVVAWIETFLQNASADVTQVLFRITGTPVYREGLRFLLPNVLIEVAPECSGIRSSIVMVVSTLLLGHLFLRSGWNQAILLLLTIPLLVLKNAIRIATLSWLGAFVSRDYLTGNLHHQGGIIFFIIGMLLTIPLLFGLQRIENRTRAANAVRS